MDWEDMSIEVLKHVEDCLPVAPASPAALDDQPVSANTSHQDSWHRGSLFRYMAIRRKWPSVPYIGEVIRNN